VGVRGKPSTFPYHSTRFEVREKCKVRKGKTGHVREGKLEGTERKVAIPAVPGTMDEDGAVLIERWYAREISRKNRQG